MDTTSLATLNEIVCIEILCKLPAVRLFTVIAVESVLNVAPLFTVITKESYKLLLGGCHDNVIDDVSRGSADSPVTGNGAAIRKMS